VRLEYPNLPTLYKKTSGGAIEQWRIWVEDTPALDAVECYDIVTEYGHVDGKLQQARETVREGKNLGKANETTARDQAISQAASEHTAKLTRKGYNPNLEEAKLGIDRGMGGIRPMLAKAFEDCEKKFKFPCFAQPKLDGMRCIAVVGDDGEVTLWTREQKPIVAVPRISDYIKTLKLPAGTVLDGELYNHDLKDDFEQLISIFRKQAPASPEEQALAQYHVYDLPRHPEWPNPKFGDRAAMLRKIFKLPVLGPLHWVNTKLISSREELIAFRDHCQDVGGYEGAMARADEPYAEGKRSSALLKLKEFKDDDFDIIGVVEGKGKMAGLAIFECRAANGNTFAVKLEGELEGLRKYLVDESTWKGKKLTVKYFTLTRKNGVPRFPVGKTVRDYE
jgi:DNA ligase-1